MTNTTNPVSPTPLQATPLPVPEVNLWDIFGNDTTSQIPWVIPVQISVPTPAIQQIAPVQTTQLTASVPIIQQTAQATVPTSIPSTIPTSITSQPTLIAPQVVAPSIPQTTPIIAPTIQPQTTIQNPSSQPVPIQAPVSPPTIPQIPPVVQPTTVQSTQQVVESLSVVSTPTTSSAPATFVTPIITVKKWSKISPVTFFIGCGLFWFLIIGIISMTLYFAIQNPSQFQWIIGIEGIKSGLKLFTWLFFWILFLGWFVWGIFNLYKMITTKVGSKVKYVFGIIISIALVGWSVFWGMTSFKKINEIIGTTGDQNSLLIPSIQFKDKERPISEWYPIIAPTKVSYGVNPILLNRFTTTNFPNKQVNTLTLDCGNETQKLPYNPSTEKFDWTCLYMKKWDYSIAIIANITSQVTEIINWEQKMKDLITKDEKIDLWVLPITSEISFAPSDGTPLQFNDAKDEIIIGKAPTKLNFQSDKLFSDLKLDQYNMQRDLDNDGIFDKTNVTNFARQFRVPQVQKVNYTLPDLPQPFNTLVYEFDVRVLQNEVPICTITATPGEQSTAYLINSTFDTNEPSITSYLYKIKNLGTNKFITAPVNKKDNFDYEFPTKGAYIVYLEYLTEDGKPWKCESDTIDVWSSDFSINYTTQYKWPNDTKWLSFVGQTSGAQIILTTNGITSRVLPAIIQITINSISPQSTNLQKEVKLDNQLIQTPDGKTYEITLQNTTHEKLTITVSDNKTKASSTVSIPITIIQKEIIGELKVFPDSVGISPFEVTLDASTTTITDKDDEIIYFSWDFWDGKKIADSSQSRTKHTYLYDETNQNGSYLPSVTITTKKWKKATFSVTSPILVKKPSLVSKITIDSHPAQIATVGDKVEFSLQTDGNPSHISWDFGTQEGIECDDRSCANVPMFFEIPGTYSIKATTTYKDLTTSIATTKIIIEEK